VRNLLLTLTVLFLVTTATAGDLPQFINFDGVLTDDVSGNPIAGPVSLTFKIYDPSGSCLLYEETRTSFSPDATTGNFSVRVGPGGCVTACTRNTSADGGLLWKTIFQNDVQVRAPQTNCSSGYTPATGDARKLRVIVGSTTLSPDYVLAPAPYATVAESLQGKTAADFVSIAGNQTLNGFLKLNNQMEMRFSDGGPNYVGLRSPASPSTTILTLPPNAGSAGQVLQTDGTGNLGWFTPASGGISTLNGLAGGAQTFAAGASGSSPNWSSSGAIHTLHIPQANTPGVTGGLISYSDWSAFNSKQTSLGFTPVNKAGDNMNGNLDFGSLYRVTNLATPISGNDATTKSYVDGNIALCVNKSGDTMTAPLAISAAGNASSPSLNLQGQGGMFVPAAGTLAFATSGVERMRIDNAGRVGFNTTNLSDLINIEGSANPMIRMNTTDGSAMGIKIYQGGSMKLSMVSNSSDSYIDSGPGSTMQMRANMFTNQLVLLPNGNVGIHTNAPASTLDVSKSLAASYTDVRNFNPDSTGGARYVVGSAGPAGTGSIAIETQGSASGFGAAGDARAPSTGNIWWSGTNGPMNISSAHEMRFFAGVGMSAPTSGFEKMRITQTGNVGIGTTTPAAKLDVNGGAKIGAAGTPVQLIQNYPGVTCSMSGISAGATGNCVATVSGVSTSDNASVTCHPVGTPSQPMIHSCFISAGNQITIGVHNIGASMLSPPGGWNITVIKF
jgi:hypothetical protein